MTNSKKTRLFPSPFGVHVLKIAKLHGFPARQGEFPSPFGVHVLKKLATPNCCGMTSTSFRPLSGFMF